MQVSIIAAMDANWGIGFRGEIPWHLSADLRRFRRLTTGHHVIFGRKTYESIGIPLPKRKIIVLTSNPAFSAPDANCVTPDLESAVRYARSKDETELFIGGGEQVYRQAIALTGRIYLTYVHTRTQVDRHFPRISFDEWRTSHVEHIPRDAKNDFDSTFVILDRR